GHVGDDALLKTVDAELDYVYSRTGRIRADNGGLVTVAPTDIRQHVSTSFTLSGSALGGFDGLRVGDPTAAHLERSMSVSLVLLSWGSTVYSAAQSNWTQPNTCVDIVLDPATATRRLGPGETASVRAELQTKRERHVVPAQFRNATPTKG